MSKKQDFLRGEQNRDAHPESGMRGSAADLAQQAQRAGTPAGADADRQVPHSGKVGNDHNKQGEQAPTQKNEGRRTPESRHDRESQLGSHNQSSARRGGAGGGRGPDGGGSTGAP